LKVDTEPAAPSEARGAARRNVDSGVHCRVAARVGRHVARGVNGRIGGHVAYGVSGSVASRTRVAPRIGRRVALRRAIIGGIIAAG
jgi:hypothetical protein